MTLLSLWSIVSGWGSWLWLGFLAFIPGVLNVIQPIFAAIVNGLSAVASSAWEGFKKSDSNVWVLTAILSAIAFFVGYHYGWYACIDWVHAHFRLLQKVPFHSWWKFW